MANCRKCGRWAGLIGGTECDDCKRAALNPESVLPSSPASKPPDDVVERLRPIIRSAATRAGVVAALTFLGICFALGLVYAFFSALMSSPPSH